jgi:hypothetical protein
VTAIIVFEDGIIVLQPDGVSLNDIQQVASAVAAGIDGFYANIGQVAAESNLVENDWAVNPNGGKYLEIENGQGSSDGGRQRRHIEAVVRGVHVLNSRSKLLKEAFRRNGGTFAGHIFDEKALKALGYVKPLIAAAPSPIAVKELYVGQRIGLRTE